MRVVLKNKKQIENLKEKLKNGGNQNEKRNNWKM